MFERPNKGHTQAIANRAGASRSLSVLLIAPPSILRMGLAQAIRAMPQFHLVGTADTTEMAEEMIRSISPDAFVVVRQAKMHLSPIWRDAANVIHLAFGEVDGTLKVEDLTPPALGAALRAAYDKHPKRGDSAAENGPHPARQALPPHPAHFGPQQRRVLALLTKGLTNQEIADIEGFTLATARYHISAILGKLGVSNRTEASAVAISQHLIGEEDL